MAGIWGPAPEMPDLLGAGPWPVLVLQVPACGQGRLRQNPPWGRPVCPHGSSAPPEEALQGTPAGLGSPTGPPLSDWQASVLHLQRAGGWESNFITRFILCHSLTPRVVVLPSPQQPSATERNWTARRALACSGLLSTCPLRSLPGLAFAPARPLPRAPAPGLLPCPSTPGPAGVPKEPGRWDFCSGQGHRGITEPLRDSVGAGSPGLCPPPCGVQGWGGWVGVGDRSFLHLKVAAYLEGSRGEASWCLVHRGRSLPDSQEALDPAGGGGPAVTRVGEPP